MMGDKLREGPGFKNLSYVARSYLLNRQNKHLSEGWLHDFLRTCLLPLSWKPEVPFFCEENKIKASYCTVHTVVVTRHLVDPQMTSWRVYHCSPPLMGEADLKEIATRLRAYRAARLLRLLS